MATEILLPKLGLTMTEGTITDFLVGNGSAIAVGDPIITVATDKVDVDIEAEAAGLFHAAIDTGVTLAPGALLGWLLEAGESAPTSGGTAPAPEAPVAAVATAAAVPGAVVTTTSTGTGRAFVSPNARRVAGLLGVGLAGLRGSGPAGRIVSEDVEEAAASATVAPSPAPAALPVAAPGASPARSVTAGSVTAMDLRPPLRKLARDLGVDVATIVPSGPGGSAVRADVLAAAARSASTASSAVRDPADNPVTRVIPLTGMRGAIATRMHGSLRDSAQLTHGYHVVLDAVVAVRAQLKDQSAPGEPVPSLNDFIVKAVALALREHPGLNATIVDGEVRELQDIHLGLAVAVPAGLYVPVISYADQLSLLEIAEETRALATAAREGRLKLDQLEGGTFAVSSLGTYGVDMFTPVINPGNVGILGVGQLRDGVRWHDDRPARTQELTLSLTFDHRAVDGAPAAEFLQTVDALLARPMRLLVS